MAYLTCTVGDHANPKRNAGVYGHLWGPAARESWRLRLCEFHLRGMEHDLAKYELVPNADATSILDTPSDCLTCGKPVAQVDWHLSITSYPSKNERKDYWARLHVNCRLPEWAWARIPVQD